ncbi:MAG TPA: hypothetical protein VFT43_14620 [Candidatus Polarisedimenticolia bacterium]|nr:hypothetical protein [Candidatus Polarisedimenticolia bacterium]
MRNLLRISTCGRRIFVLLVVILISAACNGGDKGSRFLLPGACDLSAADLAGFWQVDFGLEPATRTLVQCDNPSAEGRAIRTPDNPFCVGPLPCGPSGARYNVTVTAGSGRALTVVGGGVYRQDELNGSVEAGTCLAALRLWLNEGSSFIRCGGSLDKESRRISLTCDSAQVDSNGDGILDAVCKLDTPLDAIVTLLGGVVLE